MLRSPDLPNTDLLNSANASDVIVSEKSPQVGAECVTLVPPQPLGALSLFFLFSFFFSCIFFFFFFVCSSFRCMLISYFGFVGLAETVTDLEKPKAVGRGKKCQTKTTTKLMQKLPWGKLLSQCPEVNLFVVFCTCIPVCSKETIFACFAVFLFLSLET